MLCSERKVQLGYPSRSRNTRRRICSRGKKEGRGGGSWMGGLRRRPPSHQAGPLAMATIASPTLRDDCSVKCILFSLGCTMSLVFALQGFDVTLLEAGAQPGGLVAGWKTPGGRSVEVGIHGTGSSPVQPPLSWFLSKLFV